MKSMICRHVQNLRMAFYVLGGRNHSLLTAICFSTTLLVVLAQLISAYTRMLGSEHFGAKQFGMSPAEDSSRLYRDDLGLSSSYSLLRVCVEPEFSNNVDRGLTSRSKSSLRFDQPFTRTVHRATQQMAVSARTGVPCQPLKLRVSRPYQQKDHSDLLFAVATSLERLQHSLPQFRHWLAETNASLIAIIHDSLPSENGLEDIVEQYARAGVKLVATAADDPENDVNTQHFTMLRKVLNFCTSAVKWIVVIDDDTFFPSLTPIKEALNAHNSSADLYLGALSENSRHVGMFGRMAFGGAGVFLTKPLAQKLERQIETCLSEISIREGDGLLASCIHLKTETNLTLFPGLQQLDIFGDPSGFYESGRLPMSLHHWKSWHHVPVSQMAMISRLCGDCFLQRWDLGNNVVLNNGYSIAIYRHGLENIDLDQLEATWEQSEVQELWLASFGKLRDKLDENSKKTYFFVDSKDYNYAVRQTYVHKASRETKERGDSEVVDEVVELWWNRPRP